MRDYRLRAQRKRKQRKSERRQGGVGFDRFLTSFFFFSLCCVHRRSGRDGRETRHSTVVNLLYFVAPNCPRASREPPRTRHRVERERERITEKVDFRRAKVCRQKSEGERERDRDREKKRRKRVYGSIGCSATRGLVSGSVDDDLLLYRNLLVFCPTYQR